jgi:hypothetical protein
MDGLNCSVRAYDPSVSYPAKRSAVKLGLSSSGRNQDTHFQKLGLGPKKGRVKQFQVDTLANILNENGHRYSSIFYLKVRDAVNLTRH